MKTVILFVTAVVLFFSDPSFEMPYAKIEQAFAANDSQTIISLGKEKILLKIADKEGGYNHNQAILILQDFFVRNPKGSFNFTFKGKENSDGVFCMALYATKSKQYTITFQFKKMKSTYQFESLSISNVDKK